MDTPSTFLHYDPMTNTITLQCPNCTDVILIEQFNCYIFRHGIFKNNYTQIPPHLPKSECDFLKENNLIFGCGKPFQIVPSIDHPMDIHKMRVQICDYI
jgi:hypothetical protein